MSRLLLPAEYDSSRLKGDERGDEGEERYLGLDPHNKVYQ